MSNKKHTISVGDKKQKQKNPKAATNREEQRRPPRKYRRGDASSDDDDDDTYDEYEEFECDDDEEEWETDDDDDVDDEDLPSKKKCKTPTKSSQTKVTTDKVAKLKKSERNVDSKTNTKTKSNTSTQAKRRAVTQEDDEDNEENDDDEDSVEACDASDEDNPRIRANKGFSIMICGGGGRDGGGGSSIGGGGIEELDMAGPDDVDSEDIEELLRDGDDDMYDTDEDEGTFMKEVYESMTGGAVGLANPFDDDDDDDLPLPKGKKARAAFEAARQKAKAAKAAKRELKQQKMAAAAAAGNGTPAPTTKTADTETETEYHELVGLRKHLVEKLAKNPRSQRLRKALRECRKSIQDLVKETRVQNTKEYFKLVTADQKQTSEFNYFKKKLSHAEQKRIVQQIAEINQYTCTDVPHRITLLQSSIPPKYKATVMQKLNMLRYMEPGDNEYTKMKTWVDTFMRVPFDRYKSVSISYVHDGLDACDAYMRNAKRILDDCVYGMEDAKMQVLQMVGQWITNPAAMGTAIAIHGPPGTAKTTLIKDGISKILGREFAFLALGGAGDASFLEGHSYTYEGSSWGKIIQILIDSKCMNPVIYFDELDKVSDSARGQEIIGVLTHLTDTTQNGQYHDKYFSEVDFDLSKCLFIFSYNDENLVNPILRDRMYRIKTSGYDTSQKVIIAKKYILPKIREQVNFAEGDVVIPDDVLRYIISSERFTQKEEGVRNLKRCLEIIHTKLNLFRLIRADSAAIDSTQEGSDVKADTVQEEKKKSKDAEEVPFLSLLGKDANLKVTFPYTVTTKDVDVLIKNEEKQNQSLLAMYT